MKIINTNADMIRAALAHVNGPALFGGNIKLRECFRAGNCGLTPVNAKGTTFEARLTVVDSRKAGARVGRNGRRISSACWHVVGHFCAYLLERGAKIRAAGGIKYNTPGDNWQGGEKNIGSIAEPLYFSEACRCGESSLKTLTPA